MAPTQSTPAAAKHSMDPVVIQTLTEMMQKANTTGHLISAWETMQSYLVSTKLAWYSKALPEFVGIDKANRSM